MLMEIEELYFAIFYATQHIIPQKFTDLLKKCYEVLSVAILPHFILNLVTYKPYARYAIKRLTITYLSRA